MSNGNDVTNGGDGAELSATICSRLLSWKWWVVFLFVVPVGVTLWLPTKVPAVMLLWLGEKAEDLDDRWVRLLNRVFIPPFEWARKHYENAKVRDGGAGPRTTKETDE